MLNKTLTSVNLGGIKAVFKEHFGVGFHGFLIVMFIYLFRTEYPPEGRNPLNH